MRRARWIAGIVAAVAAAGVGGAALAAAVTDRSTPAHQVLSDVRSAVLLGSDGMTITVLGDVGGCTTATRLVADQTTTRVRLSVVSQVPHMGSGVYHCPAAFQGILTTRLTRPLDARELLDHDGRPLRHLDGRRLVRVGNLPSGFELLQNAPVAPGVTNPYEPVRSPDGRLAWSRVYGPSSASPPPAAHTYPLEVGGGQSTLVVSEATGSSPIQPSGSSAVGQVTVAGHAATVSSMPQGSITFYAVSWTTPTDAYSVLLRPAYQHPVSRSAAVALLERVADALQGSG